MRILLVTPLLPHPGAPSAGALVMYGQLRTLARCHRVTLATFFDPATEGDALEGLRREGLEVHGVPRGGWRGIDRWRRRLRLTASWVQGSLPFRTLRYQEPAMQLLLDRLLASEPFDLVQVEDNAMAAYRFPSGLPAVLTEHEVRAAADGSRDERRWAPYQAAVWGRFDRVQVFTARDAAAAAAIAPGLADRLRVNPFGVDLPPEGNSEREEPGSVVFVGGFLHPPNVDAALWLGREIFPLLRARLPRARLTLVGDRPPPAVRALQGGGIAVTGRVPAVEPYLERAAVVLAPLRSGGGMRLKVLQAMAAGKAVVASPLAAEGIAAPGGEPVLALAVTAQDFASRTAALLERPAERRTLGQRARETVAAHHGWTSYGQRREAMYAELLAPAGVA
ncbi:MAG TPA: glycosyltransferase [Thermoanaerobaculia bacterium]|nr:glycosyltransferase [Thermoanaerobaculia bacterium]